MDRPETSAVPGGHILVEGLDGIGARKLTVLLVHVVGSATGVIADPDSKVLDFLRTLLMDLSPVNCPLLQSFFCRMDFNQTTYHIQRHNLTGTLFDFPELLEEIPEAGFSDDGVGSEEAHAVKLGSRIRIRGQFAADNLVFR